MKAKLRQQVTTAIILETRMPRKDGHYPVKLRVTFQRKQKFYTIRYIPEKIGDDFSDYQKFWLRKTDKSISMTEKEFDKVRMKNPMEPFKTMAIYINKQESEAQETVAKINPFAFDRFEAKFFYKASNDNDLFSVLKDQAKEKRRNGKISTAVTYECALNSLKEFTKKEQYPFSEVTVKFLKEYEKWMLGKQNSKATIGMYLRNVRAVFNLMKPVGVIYPFGKSKYGLYSIPKGKNTKKALTQADVGKIAAYKAIDGTIEERSRDYWLFSYLCNGINLKDIARLKYTNIISDKIVLERAKTEDSVEDEASIVIIITRQIARILSKWGNTRASHDQYIFPILSPGMTPQDEYRAIQQTVQTINKNMERICKVIGIEKVTTYTARHSFATVLKRSGASVEFISESLGHKSKQTTQNYLAGFEDDEKRKWAERVTDFEL